MPVPMLRFRATPLSDVRLAELRKNDEGERDRARRPGPPPLLRCWRESESGSLRGTRLSEYCAACVCWAASAWRGFAGAAGAGAAGTGGSANPWNSACARACRRVAVAAASSASTSAATSAPHERPPNDRRRRIGMLYISSPRRLIHHRLRARPLNHPSTVPCVRPPPRPMMFVDAKARRARAHFLCYPRDVATSRHSRDGQ